MSKPILVVDDDSDMVRTLCDILRLRGWDPIGMHSGHAAVEEECAKRHPVVLMDIVMPDVDGITALKAMKECHPTVRVVLMTAHAAEEKLTAAIEAGASDVLSKPIDIASLIDLLN